MKQTAISEPATWSDPARERSDLLIVDRSVRVPVLIFLASGVFWLIAASAFWLLVSSQIHTPTAWWTFPGVAWLSFGRAYPAFLNCFVYGWASSAGIGAGIWLLARLCNAPLRNLLFPILAGIIWNIGVGLGLLSILAGGGNGRELLEFPSYAAFALSLAFLIIGVWVILVIWRRRTESTYISQWYLFTAFLCFAWMYATANLLLNLIQTAGVAGIDRPWWYLFTILLQIGPAPGVAQAAIHAWYVKSLIGLWLTPIALAIAYYLIPKFVGRPIYSYKLALLGFWAAVPCAGFSGLAQLIGGPFPAWMITLSIVATVLAIIPVLAVAVNFHLTTKETFEAMSWNLALRFVVFGAMIYTLYGFEAAATSIRTIGRITEFTFVSVGQNQLGLYGFYSMILFGALYYIVPRLLDRPWLFAGLVRFHFWLNVIGIGLLWFDLTMGGLIQGFGLQDPKVSMDAITDILKPFLLLQNVATLLLVVANLSFAAAFLLIFCLSGRVREGSPVREPSTEKTPEVTVA